MFQKHEFDSQVLFFLFFIIYSCQFIYAPIIFTPLFID